MNTAGIHHITALAGDAQKNLDFYADTLGLRLVKKTINFDAPDVYHLYFGDAAARRGRSSPSFPGARFSPPPRRRAGDRGRVPDRAGGSGVLAGSPGARGRSGAGADRPFWRDGSRL